MKITSYLLLASAVISVAVADVFLKKASLELDSFKEIFRNPWFLIAVVLYLAQIVVLGYLFFSGNRLVSIGILQIVLYAMIIILSGIFVFGEGLSIMQSIGIFLAIIGVTLLNL